MSYAASIIEFETKRKKLKIIPPMNSNAFYDIGRGRINLFSVRDNPDDYRFDLFIDKNEVYTGYGSFEISGERVDISKPYRNLIVTKDSSLYITQAMDCNGGKISSYGTLVLQKSCVFTVRNAGEIIIEPHSIITFERGCRLEVEDGSKVIIYGKINIHIDELTKLRESPNIILDSAAVLNVIGINTPSRIFSITDYVLEMHGKYINIHTQGEKNFEGGRMGYIWQDGSPFQPSQVIELIAMYGRVVLGDFRLSVLGEPEQILPKMQIVKSIRVRRKAVLHIDSEVEKYRYYYPELYLGKIIGNSKNSAKCIVEGKIIAGKDAIITIDRHALMRVEENGEVHLRKNAILRSTHNDDQVVLEINGKLFIDSMEQLVGFRKENIVFGENGKLIVLNPSKFRNRVLLSIPEGIKESRLYQLFLDRIDKVEFHLSAKTGIKIDKNYESYSLEMRDWYGGVRLEQAIKNKWIVWHDEAFIELNRDITPWIAPTSSLLVVGRIFKCYGSTDQERLQDVVNRLISIGCGSIKFRFGDGSRFREVKLRLGNIKMIASYNDPSTRKYVLITNNTGMLFIRNKVGSTKPELILSDRARKFKIPISKELEFNL